MNNMNGMKVEARESYSQCIIITTIIKTGVIVKTNKKSIKVRFNHLTKTRGNKVEIDMNTSGEYTFTYWKTIVPEYGPNEGKATRLYKNQLNGIIEIAE